MFFVPHVIVKARATVGMSRYPGNTHTTDGAVSDADIDWCHDAVEDVSRTFAITIDILEEPMSSAICVGYLLCRVADTIEDAQDISPDEQKRLLSTYDSVLDPDADVEVDAFEELAAPHASANEDSDDWGVVSNASRVLATFESQPRWIQHAVRPPVREMVQGMTQFIDRYAETHGLRIQTLEELEQYCYYVAGTVGELITRLVCAGNSDADERRLLDLAESFGLLLQLVNIAKDVYVDFQEENNVYLPVEWLREHGVSPDAIGDTDRSENVVAVVKRVVDHARTQLDDAQRYLELAPEANGNTLAAWGVPFLLAVGTIRELRARPEDALTEDGVKIPRAEVLAVVAEMTNGATKDSLGELRSIIAHTPYHRAQPEPN